MPQHPHTAAVLSLFPDEEAEPRDVVSCHGHPESALEPDSPWAWMPHRVRPHTNLPQSINWGGSNAEASLPPLRT